LLARLSAAFLAFVFYTLKSGSPDFEKSVHDLWRRSHYFGYTSSIPTFFIVFRSDGTPFLVTHVNSTDFARFRLRSCTPVGILLEIREKKLLLDVMAS
jgi:hypothetical protein